MAVKKIINVNVIIIIIIIISYNYYSVTYLLNVVVLGFRLVIC